MPAATVMDDGPEPGSLAMARDQALLEAARDDAAPGTIVRGHGWTCPVLSLGRGQPYPEGLDDDAAGAGVAVVRRPTGGGWLLHLPGDLSLSLVLGGPLGPGALRGATRTTAHAIADGLGALGRAALVFLGASSPLTREEVCFQRTDRDEVLVGETKVAGVALARQGRAALVQSAIPLAPAAGAGLEEFARRWDPRRAEAAAALAGIEAAALWPHVAASALRRLALPSVSWRWTDGARERALSLERRRFLAAAFTREGRVEPDA